MQVVFPCAHAFCLYCTVQWRRKNNDVCPVCRAVARRVWWVDCRHPEPLPGYVTAQAAGEPPALMVELWARVWRDRTLSSLLFWVAWMLWGTSPAASASGRARRQPDGHGPPTVIVVDREQLVRSITMTYAAVLGAIQAPHLVDTLVPLRRLGGDLRSRQRALQDFGDGRCHLIATKRDCVEGTVQRPGCTLLLLGSPLSSTHTWGRAALEDGILQRRLRPAKIIEAAWAMDA